LTAPVEREWNLLSPDPSLVREFSASLGLTSAAAKALANRGISDLREADRFLRGTLSDLPDPSLLKDAGKAAERLVSAGTRGEPVLIYADYDADGATGAACVFLFLREMFPDLPVRIHQNDRLREGYGLQARVLADAARDGFRLVVTVDLGISDVGPVREASDAGVEVIVTDHHLPGDTLPGAFAVVNPRRRDCAFPEKEAAGVGVAFLLLCAVRKNLRERGFFEGRDEIPMRRFMDLVALGTVADMAPLLGGNRLLVREGIREIRRNPRPGIDALFTAAGVSHADATEADLGFRVAPRLNAAGRMGDASRSSRILVSTDGAEAARIARELNHDNGRRQREEGRILAEAVAGIEASGAVPPAIVLCDASWHLGVLGIVASKILERYGRPVVMLREEGGTATGSCRSVDGFSIVEALAGLSPLLTRFGGHAQAAGVALDARNLDLFRRGLSGVAARHEEVSPFVLRRSIDAEVGFGEIGPGLLSDLERMRPFGVGNREPLFLLRNARVSRATRMGGAGEHLRFEAEGDGGRVEGVAFHRDSIPSDASGRSDLLFALQENVFRGTRSVRLLLRDAGRAGRPVLCGGSPPR
jgi:single-stranded-DNA-specific exonuclease